MRTDVFIAGDWGTTQLRLFLCDDASVIDTRSGRGVRTLERSPEAEFAALTADWTAAHRIDRAVLSGMVGSRNGWLETAYAPCPASLDGLKSRFGRLQHGNVSIAIVPGLSCVAPNGAPDVMRGEETQLFGAMLLDPSLATGRQLLALPGTHTKWVLVENGTVMHFQTALTGELFALLRMHSTLLATGSTIASAIDDAYFEKGLQHSAQDPSLLHELFQVRSRQLIDGMSAEQASGLLSGILIGADVDGAMALMQPHLVTLICEPALAQRYAQALRSRGIESRRLDGNECVLAGLRALAT